MKNNPLQPVALIVTSNAATANFLRKALQLTFQLIEREDTSSAYETIVHTSLDLVILDSKGLDNEALFLSFPVIDLRLEKENRPFF